MQPTERKCVLKMQWSHAMAPFSNLDIEYSLADQPEKIIIVLRERT